MKWLVVVACVLPLVWSLKDGTYFMACQLTALHGTAPSGLVACMLGPTGSNNSLACSFQYKGLVGSITGADITSTALPTLGSASFGKVMDFSAAVSGVSGVYPHSGSFDAVVLEYVQLQGTTQTVTIPAGAYNGTWGDFQTTLLGCFSGDWNCVATVRTDMYPGGEAACDFGGMIYGADFEFPLAVNTSIDPTSKANGYAWLNWYVTSEDTYNAVSVWAYAVDFDQMSGPVNYAGIFNALGAFPILTSNPASLAFDIDGAYQYGLTSGSFIGLAIQGNVGTGQVGSSSGYNLNAFDNWRFLTNCSMAYCYVGVQTTAHLGFMELRGQLSDMARLVPSLLTLVVALISVSLFRL